MVAFNMLASSEVSLWLSLVFACDAQQFDALCHRFCQEASNFRKAIFLLLLALTTITTAFITSSHVQSSCREVVPTSVLETHGFCNCPERCHQKADAAMSDLGHILHPGATSVSNELSSAAGRSLAAAGTSASGSIQIHSVSPDTAQINHQISIKATSLLTKDGTPVQISNLFLAAGSAGSPFGGTRSPSKHVVGLTAADGTMLLTRGEAVVWKREEALAGVSAALFVDLPADAQSGERADAGHQKTSIGDHIQSQFLSLKVIICFKLRTG